MKHFTVLDLSLTTAVDGKNIELRASYFWSNLIFLSVTKVITSS